MHVKLTDEAAAAMELPGGGGDYVFSAEPAVDLKVGEDALLFLDWEPIDGLYEGKYGERFELFPCQRVVVQVQRSRRHGRQPT
ncbi:MAG: hypothetical protein KatS3mg014_2266 [Actinomycetota bacterium]|nr:MAG: hypothetical protein KatS3mg014_2266 [Actinomycetota bacterium]